MKALKTILCICLCLFLVSACENYLDKAPESGLSEQKVFSSYKNFIKFFDAVYEGNGQNNIKMAYNLNWNFIGWHFTTECLTDMSDYKGSGLQISMKGGVMGSHADKFTTGGFGIVAAMFKIIRECNITLQNINKLQDASQEDKDDLVAQAHFVRAFAHFSLFRFYGALPYIKKPLGPEDDWDMPQLTAYQTLTEAAADLDTATIFFEKAGRMRRDNPVVGGAGHLNHPDQFRPNGVAAKALRARILLYAASPLNSEGTSDWEKAAEANWEALQTALDNGYFLLSQNNYTLNYVGTRYTDEQLWSWSTYARAYTNLTDVINSVFRESAGSKSGECPTQNCVDKFETINGDPLNTEADRLAATTAGTYNEQDPYRNRDPRFYINVIHNQATIPGTWQNGRAQIYYEVVNGAVVYSQLLNPTYSGITRTGYYQRKNWGGQSVKNKTTSIHTDPLIRLAELYLNYAEAANEAYGPKIVPAFANMSSEQAINVIRNRVGMPNIQTQFVANKDIFRDRIKNERYVELAFENHHYFDLRRWKDASKLMSGTFYGINIEKVPVSPAFPIGFKYTRVPLPFESQTQWKDAMYYFPFPAQDRYLYKDFILNENW